MAEVTCGFRGELWVVGDKDWEALFGGSGGGCGCGCGGLGHTCGTGCEEGRKMGISYMLPGYVYHLIPTPQDKHQQACDVEYDTMQVTGHCSG